MNGFMDLMDWFPLVGCFLQLVCSVFFWQLACIFSLHFYLLSQTTGPGICLYMILLSSLQFIYLDSTESFTRLYVDDFTEVSVQQSHNLVEVSFTGALFNWIHFSHVLSSTGINVSSMHYCSINARKLFIWFRHGSISSSFLSLWWSSKSCYNIAFVVAPPLLCTYK